MRVVDLAALASVRFAIDGPHAGPHAAVDFDHIGFLTMLEGCRAIGVEHPVSLSAASKKVNELMAHASSHLFRLPTTGLRFFTVCGPCGPRSPIRG